MIRSGQSIIDVCLQNFGTVENLFDLLSDNKLNLDSKLKSGQEIQINTIKKGNETIKRTFQLNGIFVTNSQIQAGAFSNDFGSDFNT